MSPLTSDELVRLRQAMLLGTTRQPLAAPASLAPILAAAPGTADPALVLLALVGQRQRFERPDLGGGHEVPEAARRMHADTRPILPERARRTLGRLAGGLEKSHATQVVPAALQRIASAGFRPHPFDFPRLVPYLNTSVRTIGLSERAFLALSETPSKNSPSDILHTEITAENWTEFPKGHRCQFLRQERTSNPAAARALLEGTFKSEPAAVRADLIQALAVGLGPDDLRFLESLSSDRADSVKKNAAALAARVRGTPAHAARLVEAARCFKRSTAAVASILKQVGIASSGSVTFVMPKAAAARERAAALQRLFEGLSLADLAAETGLAAENLLAALPDDDMVLNELCATAVQAGDDVTILRLVEAKLMIAAVHPPLHILKGLAEELPSPLSEAVAAKVLASAGWSNLVRRYREATTPAALKDDGSLVMTAVMLPASAMPAFLKTIEALLPGTARSARDFADLVLALAAAAGPPTNISANKLKGK